MRAQLAAAGALIGVPVRVTEALEWRLDDRGLVVGLGWYASRGHGSQEAVALALLHLWEGARIARVTPDRARRRRTLGEARPADEPLLATVLRLQAVAELLTALPGLRAPVHAALRRALPEPVAELPRHLQWVVLLTEASLGLRDAVTGPAGLDSAVRAEWDALVGWVPRGTEGSAVFRRIFGPDPSRTPLARFERALAATLPAYERLRARDAEDRGLAAAGHADAGAVDDAGASLGVDDAGREDAAAGGDPAADRERSRASVPDAGESERARAGDRREAAEGSDLFAAEHAAFVETMLKTPLPADGALIDAALELDAERDDAGSGSGGAASTRVAAEHAEVATASAHYRARVAELAVPIERMRDLWQRVIAERTGQTRTLGRRALPEGDELVPEALAAAVAEAKAGVAQPAAYRQREHRRRRTRRAGSTDYALLIDRSASMGGVASAAAADAALIMLEGLAGVERDIAYAERVAGPSLDLELDIRTALIVFDAAPLVVKPLSGGLDDEVRRELHAEIRSPRGATNDAAALRAAADQFGLRGGGGAGPLSGRERRRIVIVVSDGGSNDPVAAGAELRRLRDAGVRVHGIGIGNDDVVRRYAPTSQRLDDPRSVADALRQLIEDELP